MVRANGTERTGWVDVDLTPAGEREARRAGDLLVQHDLLPDVLHTSLLRRAIRTAHIALDVADRHWIPVRRSWRLNERHYGALQGKNRVLVREEFGDEQFMLWRRSYNTLPPPLQDDEHNQAADPRYADLLETMPRTECLKDVVGRMLPYWYDAIVPDLRLWPVVLVVAHQAGKALPRSPQTGSSPGVGSSGRSSISARDAWRCVARSRIPGAVSVNIPSGA